RRPLAEELDLDAVALEVAVADESDELVALEGPEHGGAGLRAVRHDGEAELAAELDEPLEQLGRLERLHHHRRREAGGGEPGAAEVPAAEVGQGHDHALAGHVAVLDVADALPR